jgi:hypothetical protein
VPHRRQRTRCEFDATPWFREADPQSILHLAEQGWSSVFVADALEARPGYEGLHQLVEYAATRLREESLEDPTWATFDCVVSQPDAARWLARTGRRSQPSSRADKRQPQAPGVEHTKLLAQIAPAETRSLRRLSYVGSAMLQPASHAPWLRVRTTSLGWGASFAELFKQ